MATVLSNSRLSISPSTTSHSSLSRLLGVNALEDGVGEVLHALDEGGEIPHFFFRIEGAVGGHAGSADAVLDDPEHFRLGVRRGVPCEFGRPRVFGFIFARRFSRLAVAAGTAIDVENSAGDEIFISGRKRILCFGCVAADGGVHCEMH